MIAERVGAAVLSGYFNGPATITFYEDTLSVNWNISFSILLLPLSDI